MKGRIEIDSGQQLKSVKKWLHSIGINSRNDSDINGTVLDFKFIRTPAILELFSSLEKSLKVCMISNVGVTFYLIDLMMGGEAVKDLCFDLKCVDGCVFVPMTNVESISTVGGVVKIE